MHVINFQMMVAKYNLYSFLQNISVAKYKLNSLYSHIPLQLISPIPSQKRFVLLPQISQHPFKQSGECDLFWPWALRISDVGPFWIFAFFVFEYLSHSFFFCIDDRGRHLFQAMWLQDSNVSIILSLIDTWIRQPTNLHCTYNMNTKQPSLGD